MYGVRDKVIIITGTTGIGAETARLAAAAGARVLVAGSDQESCEALSEELNCPCWLGELSGETAGESVVSQCVARFGRVDALFNVAGVSGRRFGDGPVHECTDAGWDLTLAVNLKTVFLFSRAAIARMLVQEPGGDGLRGSILNVASVLAFAPEPRHFATHAYAASKGAVAALTKSMAAYYAPHKIRVNAIAPGMVRTAVSERAQNTEVAEVVKKKQALVEGMIDAGDVARTALFLLGGDAPAITGDVVAVDAGWSAA